MLDLLLEFNANVDYMEALYDKTPALHYAIKSTQVSSWKHAIKLIEANADLNYKDEDGNDALLVACKQRYSSARIVNCLIEHYANVNTVDNSGVSALHYAVMESTEISILLIENGAEFKHLVGHIMWELEENESIIRCMLDHGFDPDYAMENLNLHGFDPDYKDNTYSLVMYAMENLNLQELAVKLIKMGADLCVYDEKRKCSAFSMSEEGNEAGSRLIFDIIETSRKTLSAHFNETLVELIMKNLFLEIDLNLADDIRVNGFEQFF